GFPYMEHACVPGSSTTPGRPSACVGALGHIAFRYTDSVGARNQFSIAAQWLACTFPCRRFADILADACARLGADVVRYSFIVVDLHHLLLVGLPAHLCENAAEIAPLQKLNEFSRRQVDQKEENRKKRAESGHFRPKLNWAVRFHTASVKLRREWIVRTSPLIPILPPQLARSLSSGSRQFPPS